MQRLVLRSFFMAAMAGLVAGCGGAYVIPGDGSFGSCGIMLAGDIDDRLTKSPLTEQVVEWGVKAVINAASLTTDYRLDDQTENCRSMLGYRVYTKRQTYIVNEDGVTVYGYWDAGRAVAGTTDCVLKYMTIGIPESRDWRKSALTHELFHVMQGCHGLLPAEPGSVDGHENWTRDGIYQAIDYADTLP